MELNNIQAKFTFLEKYYPNYFGCDQIAFLLDMEMYLTGELERGEFLERTKLDNCVTDSDVRNEFDRVMNVCLTRSELIEQSQK